MCGVRFADSEPKDPNLYSFGGPNVLGFYVVTSKATDGFARVLGVAAGSGALRVTVTEVAHPTGLVPLVDPTGQRYWCVLGLCVWCVCVCMCRPSH